MSDAVRRYLVFEGRIPDRGGRLRTFPIHRCGRLPALARFYRFPLYAQMRILLFIVALLLTGCSGLEERQLPTYTPPGAMEVAQGLTRAATGATLAEPLMASPVRAALLTAPGSPGTFVACVKSVVPDPMRSPQAVFFKDGVYLSSRLALGPDGCHREPFEPFTKVKPTSDAQSKR